ncbi:MAG: pyocin knob domain-containing protein [Cytophagales bacterium]|nr:pyocin knob domain-containing protein [Cytophagales bacterium]
MKRLHFETGGRARTLDDLDVFQKSVFDAIEAFFKGKGAFIIYGCTVTGNDISAGIVFIDSQIMEFPGASGVTFPAYIKKADDLLTVNRTYETGGSKPTQKHIASELATSAPGSGEYIIMSATGGRTFWDAVAGEVVRMKGNQIINGVKTFNSDIKVLNKTLTQWLATKANSSHSHVLGDLPTINSSKVDSSISIAGVITLNQDLNNYTNPGLFAITAGALNPPPSGSFMLVFSAGSIITQIAIANNASMYKRSQSLGTWGTWALMS